MFAGYGAQAGALDLLPVVVATFAGGYLGDEARFALARAYGIDCSTKWPRMHRALMAARALSSRYGWLYVFLYRYPKGMRTVGALPMGLGPMSWLNFTFLNAASAGLWTFTLVGLGYAFGAQIAKSVESGWGVLSTALLLTMALAILFAWWRLRRVGASL